MLGLFDFIFIHGLDNIAMHYETDANKTITVLDIMKAYEIICI